MLFKTILKTIIELLKISKHCAKRSPVHFTQFPPMVTLCRTTVHDMARDLSVNPLGAGIVWTGFLETSAGPLA